MRPIQITTTDFEFKTNHDGLWSIAPVPCVCPAEDCISGVFKGQADRVELAMFLRQVADALCTPKGTKQNPTSNGPYTAIMGEIAKELDRLDGCVDGVSVNRNLKEEVEFASRLPKIPNAKDILKRAEHELDRLDGYLCGVYVKAGLIQRIQDIL